MDLPFFFALVRAVALKRLRCCPSIGRRGLAGRWDAESGKLELLV